MGSINRSEDYELHGIRYCPCMETLCLRQAEGAGLWEVPEPTACFERGMVLRSPYIWSDAAWTFLYSQVAQIADFIALADQTPGDLQKKRLLEELPTNKVDAFAHNYHINITSNTDLRGLL